MRKILPVILLTFIVSIPIHADTTTTQNNEISFLEAVNIIQNESPKIAASKASVQSQIYQNEAVSGLGRPNILLTSTWGYYNLNLDVGMDRFREIGLDLADTIIDERVPSILKPFFRSSNHYELTGDQYEMQLKGHTKSTGALLVWPVYTGGLITAVKNISEAKVEEMNANDLQTYSDTHRTLVERYFGSQLLRQVMQLRQDAVKAIAHHDYTAKRMMEEGLISKVERLQASVALEDAKRNAEKAINDSQLADLALQKMLLRNYPVQTKTPLFVHKEALSGSDYFATIALEKHPGLALVKAKKDQAKGLKKASDSRWKPNLAVVGYHELDNHKANKMIGVNASWTLYSSISRSKMQKSAQQKIVQAELTEQQARDDIALLIEKNWREVENARETFFALQSNLDVANEYLRLRTRGLQEGINTMSDLIDAEVNLEKAKTERLKAAYDYIIALNELATSTGQPELFEEFLKTSDIRLK
ncbi:TolC family protein [Neisseriaceae bacterium PsAf]|nr:TolC family protein [Neisseriaceae bacterium PsAf]